MKQRGCAAAIFATLNFVVPVQAQEGGYEQETIISDGPIIYGGGMNADDRQQAWKRFFLMMVEMCGRQQGMDALSTKLAKRCYPEKEFCTIGIDANLIGIGGIAEPRKVLLLVTFDIHNQEQQTGRVVCTWPVKGAEAVCREWYTGKLVPGGVQE